MTSGALKSLVNEMGLSNVSKRLSPTTISQALRTLDGFNIVTKANGGYSDPSYSFFILPSIRYIISSEKLNALYTLITRPDQAEEETSSSQFENLGGELWNR